MLSRIREQQDVDYVIVHKVDRFARNRVDDALLELELRQHGAQLVSVMENIDQTPSGQLMHGIMATIAEFYSANLATEARKGMTQKAKVGGTPNRAPIGYLNVRQVVDGREIRTVEIDPERVEHVKWAWHAYAWGEWSLNTITEELERRGLATRPTPKRPAHPLHRSHVEGMLANPYYVGTVVFDGVEYEGRHPAIIDRETFQRVQDLRASRAEARLKIHQHPHYLKGSLVCDYCDHRMGVMSPRGRGGQYHYFYCLNQSKRRSNCPQEYVSQAKIERLVEDCWVQVQLSSERIAEARLAVQTMIAQARSRSEAELQSQRRRLHTALRQQAKAKEAYYADALSLDEFKAEQRRISREINDTQRIIERCEAGYADAEQGLGQALSLCANAHALYLAAPADIRRMLNQAVFTELRVRNERLAEPVYTDGFQAVRTISLGTSQAQPVQARWGVPASPENSWETGPGDGQSLALTVPTSLPEEDLDDSDLEGRLLGGDIALHGVDGSKYQCLVRSSRFGLTWAFGDGRGGCPQVKRAQPTLCGG